jgi:hypothetical protein
VRSSRSGIRRIFRSSGSYKPSHPSVEPRQRNRHTWAKTPAAVPLAWRVLARNIDSRCVLSTSDILGRAEMAILGFGCCFGCCCGDCCRGDCFTGTSRFPLTGDDAAGDGFRLVADFGWLVGVLFKVEVGR